MRLSNTFDHLSLARIKHLMAHGKPPVVIIRPPEPPHQHQVSRGGQQRWQASSYSDPWPDRA
jgi:hypothetical protein